MTRFLSLLLTLMVCLISVSSFAYTPPPPPANGGYVVDQAGKLSADQILQLNQKIDRISKATKNEFGILLLQSMEGSDIEDIANTTYKSWGVGKRGLDNGCLIVVAIKERKSRIETGKGVEGEVTDLQASDILKGSLNPHLKRGDFFGGFNATLDSLSGLMESRANQPAEAKPVNYNTSGTLVLGIFGIIGLVGLLIFLAVSSYVRKQERAEVLERMRQLRQKEADRKVKVASDELNRLAKLHQEEMNQKATEILNGMYDAHGDPYRTPAESTTNNEPEQILSQPATSDHKPKPIIYVPRRPLNRDFIRPESSVASGLSSTSTITETERRKLAARRQEEEDRQRRERQEEEDRQRRERQEEEDRRRREESSNSSFDWGSSSSGSSWDSGGGFGGFGGGDSGGGGSSSDW